MNLICFNICNITAKITFVNNEPFSRIIKKRYRNFIISSGPKPTEVMLWLRTIPDKVNNLMTHSPRIVSNGKRWVVRGAGFDCRLFNHSNCLYGSGIVRENLYSFDSLLRVLWTRLLLARGGFLIHACGLRNGSDGFIFPGKSGAGKTTLARKSPRHKVLSDELIGVLVKDGKPLVMGTPFWGEFQKEGLSTTQSLKGIYFLGQSTSFRTQEIPSVETVKMILKCVLFFSRQPDDIKKLLKLVKQCVSETSHYKVYLSKNTSYKEIKRMVVKNIWATR